MATLDRQLKALQSSAIFKDLSEKAIKILAKNLKEEKHSSGKILLKMDASADKVYFIEKGKVKILRRTRYGEETVLNIVEEGNVVGELAVVDGHRRSAEAVCIEDCTFLVMTKSSFDKALKEDPAFAQNLLQEFCVRLRRANDNIVRKLEIQREESDESYERLQKLMEASKNINSTLDLDKLLGLILDAATKSIDADRGTLYLVDSIKKELWSKVLQGENMVEIRLPVGKGLAGYVAETGEIINIPDAYNDPRFNPDVDKRTGYRTNNMLCMPM